MKNFLIPAKDATALWLQNFDKGRFPPEMNQDLLDDLMEVTGYFHGQSFQERSAMLAYACTDLVQTWATMGFISINDRFQVYDNTLEYCHKVRDMVDSIGLAHGRVGVQFIGINARDVVVRVLDIHELTSCDAPS